MFLNLSYLLSNCFLAGHSSGYFIFVLPIDFFKRKMANARPILTIIFKNVFKRFKADILKMFKNIQPQQESYMFLYRKERVHPESLYHFTLD